MRFDRASRLFAILAAFFVYNALMAEFIGVKIFALEESLGLPAFDWELFGRKGALNFTAGVLLWPAVFIFTDIINEYFGRRGVRMISYLTVILILYAFLVGQLIDIAIFHKISAVILLIPAIHGVRRLIQAYLGKQEAAVLEASAET